MLPSIVTNHGEIREWFLLRMIRYNSREVTIRGEFLLSLFHEGDGMIEDIRLEVDMNISSFILHNGALYESFEEISLIDA